MLCVSKGVKLESNFESELNRVSRGFSVNFGARKKKSSVKKFSCQRTGGRVLLVQFPLHSSAVVRTILFLSPHHRGLCEIIFKI